LRHRRGSGLRNRILRCQPAKLRRRIRNHLSSRVAVGLPDQGDSNTNAKRDQEPHQNLHVSVRMAVPSATSEAMMEAGMEGMMEAETKNLRVPPPSSFRYP